MPTPLQVLQRVLLLSPVVVDRRQQQEVLKKGNMSCRFLHHITASYRLRLRHRATLAISKVRLTLPMAPLLWQNTSDGTTASKQPRPSEDERRQPRSNDVGYCGGSEGERAGEGEERAEAMRRRRVGTVEEDMIDFTVEVAVRPMPGHPPLLEASRGAKDHRMKAAREGLRRHLLV